jgi:tRNA1Val (adenine37-N6)-methyltransferase
MEDFAQFDQWDDLQLGGWGLWQNSRFFRFGTDGVLLADFARCKKGEKVIDLCSGTGIVPFMMMAKGEIEQADALEIQPYLCRLMERSAQKNGCENRFRVLEGDLCNIRDLAQGGAYDTVTVNPPYEPMGRGILGQNPHRELARREVACSLEDIIAAASYLLKPAGRLVLVHRPFRLQELMTLLSKYQFSASRLQFVLGHQGERPALFLLEAIRNGRRELVTEPPFILHRADGEMSEELLKIYRKER